MELVADDERTLRKIVALFKNEGEVLLSDAGKLTLPVATLSFINRAFESIQDSDFESSFEATPANTTKLPHCHEVQIVYDFVQKLSRLKVSHRYSNPVAIDVTPFRSLRHLELKRIPIHLVNGISKVQNHLESISCTRCMASLQELFQHSGGDNSSPMSWSELQAVYLRENRITALDASLRLVPVVQILDLSHNSIGETMNYLEYVTELMMLNLNYNKISKVPCLSVTCKTRIQVLLLKYNRLTHIDGIQELKSLQELDLQGNLIASHTLLLPLKPLAKLQWLKLESNPVCYHGEHRKLTIQQIHPTAVVKLLLDGKRFSKKELKHCNYTVPTMILPHSNNELLINPSGFEQSIEQSLAKSYDGSLSATTQSEAEIQVTSIRTDKKRKTGKKGKSVKKARKPDISDMDSINWETESVGASSFKSSALEDEEHQMLKEKVESMRTQLGSDWLQTQKVNQGQTSGDGYSSKLCTQANVETGSAYPLAAEAEPPQQTAPTESAVQTVVRADKVTAEVEDGQALSQASFKSVKSSSTSPKSVATEASTRVSTTSQAANEETPIRSLRKKSSDHESLLWKSSGSETMLADFGVESEPFIVSSVDDPDESYIVTVAEKFLLEKDINGTVTEQLDLSCLTQTSAYECGAEVVQMLATEGATAFCIHLRLNYVNKSKQERRYIMEDESSAEAMYDLLQPALSANRLTALAKDRLQCLKCGHEFSKHTAKRHVKKSSFGGMKKSSSIGQQLAKYSNSLADKGTLEEALTCPQCSSDMIIELEPKELAKAKDTTTAIPPLSPLKFGFPLATSSAQTSPQKPASATRQRKQSDDVLMPKRKHKSHPAYAADSSFQSCVTESSASYKSTSREEHHRQQQPEPEPSSGSYKSIAKTMRATTLIKKKDRSQKENSSIQEYNKRKANSAAGFQNDNKCEKTTAAAESETKTNRFFPRVKLSNTKAWVESNSSDIEVLAATKSSSSTGIATRISDLDLDNQDMKSVSDTNLLGRRRKEGREFITDDNNTVLRGSGSDILVLNGSSSKEEEDEDSRSSSGDVYVDAMNAAEATTNTNTTATTTTRVLRPSGSDLWILKSPSIATTGKKKTKKEDSALDNKNSYGEKVPNLLGIVEPYCGQVALAGQLSRRPITTTTEGTAETLAKDGGNDDVLLDHELDISMSESEPDSSLQTTTTTDTFFSAKSSPTKKKTNKQPTGGQRDSRLTGSSKRAEGGAVNSGGNSRELEESSQDLDKSNPFYESIDGVDGGKNPFYDDIKTTPLAGDKTTNPFYEEEEDIEVLDCQMDPHGINSTRPLIPVSEETKVKPLEKPTTTINTTHSLGIEEEAKFGVVSSTSHRPLTRKLSSDIEVLTEESTSPCNTVLIRQRESESHLLGIPCQQGKNDTEEQQLSPVGSLSDRTINDMLDFMRSSIYDSPRDSQEREELESLIFQREEQKGNQSVTHSPQDEVIQYNYEDFSTIDHRLKLYLMMSVFGSDLEEFQLLLKCGILQYTKAEEFQGVLVASSLKLYIFRVVNKEKPEQIDKWLKLVHSQSLSELHYLDIGLGYQSFRIEFGLEATCFDLLIREELWCKTFVAQFTALLQDTTLTSQSHLQGISKNNPITLENLENQVILFTSDSVALDHAEVDTNVVRFLKGFLYHTKAQKSPISVVITKSHVCLASEDHKFPPPRCSSGKVKDKGHAGVVRARQFSFKDRQRVTDLTRVEVFKEAASDAILYFMDDNNPEEFKWVVSMTTERSLGLLLESLGHVWTEHFGVDLQISTHLVGVV